MSKLKERFPQLVDTHAKLEVIDGVMDAVAGDDGRIEISAFTNAVQKKVEELVTNEDKILEEGRKSAAMQIVSAWANIHTIRLDRNQRVPVYQMQFGFAGSYFKVGAEFVPPASMTVQDFESMIARQESRIVNAQTDLSIWREFFERARPGLEGGQNLVQLFDSGALNDALASANGQPEVEETASA